MTSGRIELRGLRWRADSHMRTCDPDRDHPTMICLVRAIPFAYLLTLLPKLMQRMIQCWYPALLDELSAARLRVDDHPGRTGADRPLSVGWPISRISEFGCGLGASLRLLFLLPSDVAATVWYTRNLPVGRAPGSVIPLASRRASDANKAGTDLEPDEMMWHVVFAEPGHLPRSRGARSRDAAIHVACELLAAGCDVRRIIEPSGSFIERTELDEHYDEGHFPGLMRTTHSLEKAILLPP